MFALEDGVLVGGAFLLMDHAERHGVVRVVELADNVGVHVVLRIVIEQIGRHLLRIKFHHHRLQSAQADAFVAVLAEDERLSSFKPHEPVFAQRAFGDGIPSTFVEDRAVLEDFHKGGAVVRGGGLEDRLQAFGVGVQRTGHESRPGGKRETHRAHGLVKRPAGCAFRDHAELGGGRGLPLGESVHAVVEKQDVDVNVATQDMKKVVAADAEAVAIAGHEPQREFRAGDLESGRKGRGAPVDGVHPIGVHVVRKAARTADSRDEDDVLAGHAQFRKHLLDVAENRVIAAAGAPADGLIGSEIRLGEVARDRSVHGFRRLRFQSTASALGRDLRSNARMRCSISVIWNGRPWTLWKEMASTRNSARRTCTSCPRFISGTKMCRKLASTVPRSSGSGFRCRNTSSETGWPWA